MRPISPERFAEAHAEFMNTGNLAVNKDPYIQALDDVETELAKYCGPLTKMRKAVELLRLTHELHPLGKPKEIT